MRDMRDGYQHTMNSFFSFQRLEREDRPAETPARTYYENIDYNHDPGKYFEDFPNQKHPYVSVT